jgi:hypothetical protein
MLEQKEPIHKLTTEELNINSLDTIERYLDNNLQGDFTHVSSSVYNGEVTADIHIERNLDQRYLTVHIQPDINRAYAIVYDEDNHTIYETPSPAKEQRVVTDGGIKIKRIGSGVEESTCFTGVQCHADSFSGCMAAYEVFCCTDGCHWGSMNGVCDPPADCPFACCLACDWCECDDKWVNCLES